MKLKAYILAADPDWIETSVLSYYDLVEEIVVSYDRNSKGWTGQPIRVEECLRRLRAIDSDRKFRFIGGDYYRAQFSPMENETYQRQCSIDDIGGTADWIIELDTDEVLPNASAFVENLVKVPKDKVLVEWPMRVFFQRTRAGKFLEVTTYLRQQVTEFPGPVATRPGVRLDYGRGASAVPRLRFNIRRRTHALIRRRRYVDDSVVSKMDAILHFSWVRSEEDILRKVRGWGHATDFNGEEYFKHVWKVAPQRWPFLYNFHPLWPSRWPALWPVSLHKRLSGFQIIKTHPSHSGKFFLLPR